MSRVLVTGGTGFVAGWCIVQLLEAGHVVRTTVRSEPKGEAVRAAVARQVDAGERLEIAVADLASDEGWAAAVAGVDRVLHVASPLGGGSQDESALIGPARDGALRVLRAAVDAGVPRVVLTSSCAAATPPPAKEDRTVDETCWTDPDQPGLTAYRKSKVLAERASWDFMEGKETELVTVLPGAIFGPGIAPGQTGSMEILRRMLSGQMPGMPKVALEIVDVRDVAALHLLAMDAPNAAAQRYIATSEFVWMKDVAAIMREELGDRAAKVPTRSIPDVAIRFLARFNSELRDLVPLLSRRLWHSPDKAKAELGWAPRPVRETVVDSARYLDAEP